MYSFLEDRRVIRGIDDSALDGGGDAGRGEDVTGVLLFNVKQGILIHQGN